MHVTKVHYGSFDQDTDPKNVNNTDYLFDIFLIEEFNFQICMDLKNVSQK